MARLISRCPVCSGELKIRSLKCPDCGMELRNDFELSPFDKLPDEQYRFLIAFLKNRGNLSTVQSELGISYPTAKRQLNELLFALGLSDDEPEFTKTEEEKDMKAWFVKKESNKASDIIKAKLMENGGKVTVYTLQGLPCIIKAAPDGCSFTSDKLPITPPYRYDVFDVVVEALISQGGKAPKGNGRNYKLGDSECDETTVVGSIGINYTKAETGKSIYDPVFVLAAVLDWAGIAHNERGYIELTAEYRARIGFKA